MTGSTAILLAIAIIGSVIGVLSYFNRKDDKLISDATWRGEINGKLDAILGINLRIDKVEGTMVEHTVMIAKLESKANSAHHRIDEICEAKKNDKV